MVHFGLFLEAYYVMLGSQNEDSAGNTSSSLTEDE